MQKYLDEATKEGARLDEAVAKIQEEQVKQQQKIAECKTKLARAKEDVASAAEQIAIEAKKNAEKDAQRNDHDLEKRKVDQTQKDDEQTKNVILKLLSQCPEFLEETGLGAGNSDENKRILKQAVEKRKQRIPFSKHGAASSSGDGSTLSPLGPQESDDDAEPDSEKIKAFADDNDPFSARWFDDGDGLLNGSMEVDSEQKEAQRIEADWQEFVGTMESPEIKEALDAKKSSLTTSFARVSGPTKQKILMRILVLNTLLTFCGQHNWCEYGS